MTEKKKKLGRPFHGKERKVGVSLYMPPRLIKAIEAEAKRRGTTFSRLAIEALKIQMGWDDD